jgi:hypothetical protein
VFSSYDNNIDESFLAIFAIIAALPLGHVLMLILFGNHPHEPIGIT